MGLMDKLRAELIDVIEWVDDSRHTLVWRFPRYHNQIKHGAQLIVRPGQEAIFVHQGKVADVFGPGQHRLETANMPVLSTLAGWKYGFDSPFKAEVYFVATRQITDLKWGTPNPVIMRDADFGSVRLRAFGSYTLKARDPRTLLAELVGTDSSFEVDEVSELLRSIINQSFADLVASSDIAVLDLASNYNELSHQLRDQVAREVNAEYGLEIPQLYIVNISLPAEVERALDARSSMNAIGDLARFQAYQLGLAMPEAAANPAGGVAGAGVGLGMGLAIAGQMQPGSPAGALPTAPPPPPAVASWHLAENGRTVGPFDPAGLAQAVAQGRLRPDTLVWTAGMAGWMSAGQVPQLAPLFRVPPLPGE
ncbi:MAG: SPFH domain-containing protein [Proteobacteria bacterium]|nr:SPFH domain-containing protein [Pseudomonadota bacterium]